MATHGPTQDSESPLRDPSQLFYQSISIRRRILCTYWIVILLAVPLWWRLTSITRLSLPTNRIAVQENQSLTLHITLVLDTDDSTTHHIRNLLQQKVKSQPERWDGLNLLVRNGPTSQGNVPNEYTIFTQTDSDEIGDRHLTYSLQQHSVGNLVDTVISLLASPPISPNRQNRAAMYAPRYRLAFSLFNEDASQGDYINDWDIPSAIHDHIQPLIGKLSLLHNFTIESQVQFVAPLTFEPQPLDNRFGLTQEHLTVFVNSAQWTLSSSVSNDHVFHFVVFLPSAQRRPIALLDAEGNVSPSNAFLLPQWGGIVVYNPLETSLSSHEFTSKDLAPIFGLFSHQLETLLGLSDLPKHIPIHPGSSGILGWQLDELLRRRTIENTKEAQGTLKSIMKLVDQIENMPVEREVLNDVQDALAALEKLFSAQVHTLTESLQSSAQALTLSSRAFFNPGMLAMLYFPAEHKYAVYTPLFASAVIPLAAAALRELIAWRKERPTTRL